MNDVLVAEQPRRAAVPAVDRAVRVLRALGTHDSGRSLSQLSRELGVSKSTLSSLLATLEQHDLVRRDAATRTFRLGPGIFELSAAASGSIDVREAARPHLAHLRDLSGETAILHVAGADETVIAERAEPHHQLKVSAPLGRRLPAFGGSVAKVLLAALPAEEAELLVIQRPLPVFTPRSIVDAAAYLDELARTRRRGYASENEEYLVGVRAVSAPVLDGEDRTIGTLSVVGVAARMANGMKELAEAVVAAAAETSVLLGAPRGGRWPSPR